MLNVKRVIGFLIETALITAMAGCGQPESEHTSMVAAGGHHTVGFRDDNRVVAVGDNEHGQCDAGGWDLIP